MEPKPYQCLELDKIPSSLSTYIYEDLSKDTSTHAVLGEESPSLPLATNDDHTSAATQFGSTAVTGNCITFRLIGIKEYCFFFH